MLGFVGPISGAIGNIAGGVFGQRSANSVRKQQQRAADRQFRRQNRVERRQIRSARRHDQRNYQLQRAAEDRAWQRSRQAADQAYQRNKYLAETQIRRTVADAKAAGINPLVALGASTSPAIAQAVTPNAAAGGAPYRGRENAPRSIIPGQPISGSAIGDGIAQLGALFDLENRGLQNQLLRSQIRATNASAYRTLRGPMSRTAISSAARRAASRSAQTTEELLTHPRRAFDILGMRFGSAGTGTEAGPMQEVAGEAGDWVGAVNFLAEAIGQLSAGGFSGAGRRLGIGRRRYKENWRP